MTEKTNIEEQKGFVDKIGDFLIKYRLFFIAVIIGLIVVSVVWGVFSAVSTSSHKKGLNQLDVIMHTLFKAASAAGDDAGVDAAREEALPKVLELASKNKGSIVGLRANMAAAELYFSQGKWSEARDCWLQASGIDEEGYTAPICYYNAAVCSEELSDLDAAVAYYQKAVASEQCEFKSHILFSLGRVLEGKSDYESAAENYTKLKDTYPSDSWTSLAESRLIALRGEGKIQ